jgi:hypothetical protein
MFSITYKPSKLQFRSISFQFQARQKFRSWSETVVEQFLAGLAMSGPAFSCHHRRQ